jgi:hypothetical protein
MTAEILTKALAQIVDARGTRKVPTVASISASFNPPIRQGLLQSWLTRWGDLNKPPASLERLPDYEQHQGTLDNLLAQLKSPRALPPGVPLNAADLRPSSSRAPCQGPPGSPQASLAAQGAPAPALLPEGGLGRPSIPADLREWVGREILPVDEWWASLRQKDGEATSAPVAASTTRPCPREPVPEAAESTPLPPGDPRARDSVPVQHEARPSGGTPSSSGPPSSPEPDWWSQPLADPGTPWVTLAQATPESSTCPQAAGHQAQGGRDASSSGPPGSPEPDWWSQPLADPGTPWVTLAQATPEFRARPQAAGHQAEGGRDTEAMEIDADFLDFLDATLNPPDPPDLDLHAPPAAPTAAPPNRAPP